MNKKKYQKILANYQKCLLIKEKYHVIEGIINFHQNYFLSIKANPIDYWECLIAYYSNSENQKIVGKETCEMLLAELNYTKEEYISYYFNNLKLKTLERKIKKDDKELESDKLCKKI